MRPMQDHLLFRLYGALAAWGEVAVGERRGTADHPTKSAVLGMVGAALGIDRGSEAEHQALATGLGFAVRTEALGRLEQDYHTTQTSRRRGHATRAEELDPTAGKVSTMLSTRAYRSDAAWTVALWSRSPGEGPSLAGIKAKLQEPTFVLYLGRKSCPPALPLHPQLVRADTLKHVFELATFPDGPFLGRLGMQPGAIYFEEHPSPGLTSGEALPRRDGIESRARWQFSVRTEHRAHAVKPGDA